MHSPLAQLLGGVLERGRREACVSRRVDPVQRIPARTRMCDNRSESAFAAISCAEVDGQGRIVGQIEVRQGLRSRCRAAPDPPPPRKHTFAPAALEHTAKQLRQRRMHSRMRASFRWRARCRFSL